MHPVVNWFSAPNFNTFNPYSQFSSSWMSFYNTDYKGCLLTTTQQQVVNVKLWIGNFLVVMTHTVFSKNPKNYKFLEAVLMAPYRTYSKCDNHCCMKFFLNLIIISNLNFCTTFPLLEHCVIWCDFTHLGHLCSNSPISKY